MRSKENIIKLIGERDGARKEIVYVNVNPEIPQIAIGLLHRYNRDIHVTRHATLLHARMDIGSEKKTYRVLERIDLNGLTDYEIIYYITLMPFPWDSDYLGYRKQQRREFIVSLFNSPVDFYVFVGPQEKTTQFENTLKKMAMTHQFYIFNHFNLVFVIKSLPSSHIESAYVVNKLWMCIQNSPTKGVLTL